MHWIRERQFRVKRSVYSVPASHGYWTTRNVLVKESSQYLPIAKVSGCYNLPRLGMKLCDVEPDWVAAQTIERRRRLLEEADREYEDRLAKARKKESALRKMAAARKKRAVSAGT